MSSFGFEIEDKSRECGARIGRITTPHGVIMTPAFVPVGTKATVKSLTPQDLKKAGVQIFFGNTYHLHLAPGEKIIKRFGGLAKFMAWKGPVMTDSGGFQVFSLAKSKLRGDQSLEFENQSDLVKITDSGVIFKSIIDGSRHDFTPEKSIQIQMDLGADIILAFDQCSPYPASYQEAKKALARTHSWLIKCLNYYQEVRKKSKSFYQALYGIVQGGVFEDLRKESAKFISEQSLKKQGILGIAIGGVAVGETKQEMRNILDWTIPFLPEDKPRHLLGMGEVDDIFEIVEAGIDTFDCVVPTRLGRTGFVFVSPPEGNLKNRFRIDIQKNIWKDSRILLDKNCGCYVCKNFTRGYLQHLFRSRELLSYRLATYHNLYFINHLVDLIRDAIGKNEFYSLKRKWLA